jgi:hypothetical protein
MKRLFFNILHADPQNTSDLVILLVLAVWVTIWLILIVDISKQKQSFFWKIVWLAFCSMPVIGGCLYSFRELTRADWSSALSIRRHNAGGKSSKSTKLKAL